MIKKCVAVAVVILLASQALFADDFQINQYTTDEQYQPAVASDGLGRYIVTWTSDGQDGSRFGVFTRRFGADGSPLGDEYQAPTTTSGDQWYSAVAANADGDTIINWTQSISVSPYSQLVFGQQYDAAGSTVGTQMQQTSVTSQNEWYPSVGMSSTGTYTIAFEASYREPTGGNSTGIFAAQFDATGTQIGSDFQVNTYEADDQKHPDLAMSPTGDFVVVWDSEDQDGSDVGVFGQRFNAAGLPQGAEFQITESTQYDQAVPCVAMDSAGGFAVTWQGHGADSYDDVFVRIFNADGTARTDELLVNQTVYRDQTAPDIAMAADGTMLMVWEDRSDSDRVVVGRWFDANGEALSDEIVISDPA